jgi:glyoxalase/bleomycin resistance protein/dioxygenase superfamily protein
MSPRGLSPHYHVGIVVPDIGAAQVELSDQLGVTWGPVLRLDAVDYRDGSGEDIVLPTAMCYSVESPHLELIEEVPGSVWVRNEHSNLHHIGFWSDDLPHDSARLAGSGCPLQLCGRAGLQAPVSFAYHRNDLGVRVEVVDATMREAMAFLFQRDES